MADKCGRQLRREILVVRAPSSSTGRALWFFIALQVYLLLATALSPAAPAPVTTRSAGASPVALTYEIVVWPSPFASWEYESELLGTGRGTRGRLSHDGGLAVRCAVDLGPLLARAFHATRPPVLDLELCYGRDRFTLSEQLQPVHVGPARRYELGELQRQRLALRLGTALSLRRRSPSLVASAHLGLVDAQFNTFQVNHVDPDLSYAVGGALDASAQDKIQVLTPLDLSLRCDLTSHLSLVAGGWLDRLAVPLRWTIRDVASPVRVRDRIAVDAVVLHVGAGVRW